MSTNADASPSPDPDTAGPDAPDDLETDIRADEGIGSDGGRRRKLPSAKRWTVVTHRWVSLVVGLVLVVITTTGAAVLYAPEWVQWTHSSTFHVTEADHPTTFPEAIETVAAAHPDFHAGSANVYSGLIEVLSVDASDPGFYGVDPGTGRITGYVNPNTGPMAFMEQVHECFFTCEDYPGYISWLDQPMPTLGMTWLEDVTVGSFVIGAFGLVLVLLAVSGIWLWWPKLRRFKDGFRLRTGRGRYIRDHDLHRLVGIVAVPFLLIWGITGASFEFHWINTAWYSVTGGDQVPDPDFTSREPDHGDDQGDISPAEALAVAQRKAGPDAEVSNLFGPDPSDPSAVYDIYFSNGVDPYGYNAYPGVFDVMVDRHDATRTMVVDYGSGPTISNKAFDVWAPAFMHEGRTVNGWWRIVWFVLALTPLVLLATGVSTWLYRRGVKKRRQHRDPSTPSPSAA